MKTTSLYNTKNYAVVSLGNGAMYEFVNKAIDCTVFFQGDDALQFEEELHCYTEAKCSTDTALNGLWEDYVDVSH